jgi:plastocyanin
MIGLAVVGGTFIVFALVSSFLAPRRRPDFPGRNGMSVYIIACFVLFGAMLTAVEVFGVESEAKGAESAGAVGEAGGTTIQVKETEFRIALPSLKKLAPGAYTFEVQNAGKTDHDFVIEGGKANGDTRTPVLHPGETVKLNVTLDAGNYTLFCSIDGHRRSGMQAKISVG